VRQNRGQLVQMNSAGVSPPEVAAKQRLELTNFRESKLIDFLVPSPSFSDQAASEASSVYFANFR
jgi:hypothetical protein